MLPLYTVYRTWGEELTVNVCPLDKILSDGKRDNMTPSTPITYGIYRKLTKASFRLLFFVCLVEGENFAPILINSSSGGVKYVFGEETLMGNAKVFLCVCVMWSAKSPTDFCCSKS